MLQSNTSVGSDDQMEPTMALQRPSVASVQDVSHILVKIFGNQFTRDPVDQEIVNNLTTSAKGSEDEFHEQYVKRLAEIQEERNEEIRKATELESIIIEAQAKSMAHYENSMNDPSERFQYKSFVDSNILRENNLLVPEDLFADPFRRPIPDKTLKQPDYLRSTTTAKERTRKIPRDDGYKDTGEIIKKYHSQGLESPPGTPVPEDFVKLIKPKWQEMPSAVERNNARKYLSILQSRNAYLRNPAYVADDTDSSTDCFKAEPSSVVFSNYNVGQVYEIKLSLRNVSATKLSLRVLPPVTSFFCLGLGKFPSNSSYIAPGLCCVYSIRFTPETLADYDDYLVVETPRGRDLRVPLLARREAPVLSITNILHAGYCLVGGIKLAEFTFKNIGGPGSFCILPKCNWPTTRYKSSIKSMKAIVEPFEIQPSMFHLGKNQKTTIDVMFSPQTVGEFSADFVFICDNCQLKHVTIKAVSEAPAIQYSLIDDEDASVSKPDLEEIVDVSASHYIRFLPINPFTYSHKKLYVENKTNITQIFSWYIFKPFLLPPNTKPSSPSEVERLWDAEAPFTITPDHGELAACAKMEFNLIFVAPYTGSFHNVLHLMFHNIPEANGKDCESEESGLESFSADGIRQDNGKNMLSRLQSSSMPVVFKDNLMLEIDIKAKCVPYDVLLLPYCIEFPGKTIIGSTVRKPFQLVNNSLAPIYFSWCNDANKDGPEIMEVEPSEGELLPGSAVVLEIALSSSEPVKISRKILCDVQYHSNPIELSVKAEMCGPEVIIETDIIDFSLVKVGTQVKREIILRNVTSLTAQWSGEVVVKNGNVDCSEYVSLSSTGGQLGPLESTFIIATFSPKLPLILNCFFELIVAKGNKSCLKFVGESQLPEVCFLNSQLNFGTVYVNLVSEAQAEIYNQTCLSTTVKWGTLKGSAAEHCTVNVEPMEAEIHSRETLKFKIALVSSYLQNISELYLPCFICGQDEPIWLELLANVKGLHIQYHDPTSSSKLSNMDFGCLDIGAIVTKTFIMRNDTKIDAKFSITTKNFACGFVSERVKKCMRSAANQGERVGLVTITSHLADPHSIAPERAVYEFQKSVLSNNKGVALHILPDAGTISAMSEVEVTITCYSDMWGKYKDIIECRVGDLPICQIPVSIEINGHSIRIQMSGDKQEPIVRFGSHTPFSTKVRRTLRINNASPCGMEINWFQNLVTKSKENLIKLKLFHNDPFTDNEESSSDLTDDDFKDVDDSTKLLNFRIIKNDGVLDRQGLFTISPLHSVIPARGTNLVELSFNPEIACDIEHDEKMIFGFCNGFVTLNNKDLGSSSGPVCRSHQLEIDPVRFWQSGSIEAPKLEIEADDVDDMQRVVLSASASDLIVKTDSGYITQNSCVRSFGQFVKLMNTSEAMFNFQISIPKHICITFNGRDFKHGDELCIQLPPKKHVKLSLNSIISLNFLSIAFSSEVMSDASNFSLRTLQNGGRMIAYSNEILLKFDNNEKLVQKIRFVSQLYLPYLKLSSDIVDFGTCFVGQERFAEISILNLTTCGSLWRITRNVDDSSVFTVTPKGGYLQPFDSIFIKNSKQNIDICFVANACSEYEEYFFIEDVLSETKIKVVLRGAGSYDGHFESLVET